MNNTKICTCRSIYMYNIDVIIYLGGCVYVYETGISIKIQCL